MEGRDESPMPVALVSVADIREGSHHMRKRICNARGGSWACQHGQWQQHEMDAGRKRTYSYRLRGHSAQTVVAGQLWTLRASWWPVRLTLAATAPATMVALAARARAGGHWCARHRGRTPSSSCRASFGAARRKSAERCAQLAIGNWQANWRRSDQQLGAAAWISGCRDGLRTAALWTGLGAESATIKRGGGRPE